MTLLAPLALAAWAYLLLFHGGFWLARETDEAPSPAPATWPPVAAIVPARDEAAVIGRAVAALLAQDYPGRFSVVLVDDGSSDGTATLARAAAAGDARLEVIGGTPIPRGWTGKLWALQTGLNHLHHPFVAPTQAGAQLPLRGEENKLGPRLRGNDEGKYLWFTDADIVHAPDTLRSLVARAEAEGLVLNSLMARLECDASAERALIPAFVFFFAMLYPFARVNRKGATAAAAGGCMLVDAQALARAGGLATIARAIIDDCAMGRAMKARGRIRLSLTRRSQSIRPYAGWTGIGRMIARSAYAQLGYSPPLLAGTVMGMALVYLVPPLAALFGHGLARGAGLAAWGLMALAFQPILRFYRRSPLWGVGLPAIAAFYTGATIASAVQHARGRGGMWKGRAQAELAP